MPVVIASLITLLLTPATAAPDADALLRRADAAARQSKDAELTLEITVHHSDGSEVGRTIRAWQRGSDQRMVKILAPPRLRGTGILAPDADRIYVYLPAYRRVREVTGREGGDAFMGTDFSVNELALVRLAPSHTAAFARSPAAGDVHVLRLTPRDPDDHDYVALRAHVRKADDLIARLDYLDAKDAVYRTITMSDFRTIEAGEARYTLAHRIEVDDRRAERRTVARLTSAAFDKGLGDGFFTERMLTRLP